MGIWQAPFLVVLVGYLLACAASNALRYLTYDLTALNTIQIAEYRSAVLWWFASVVVTVLMYARALPRKPIAREPDWAFQVRSADLYLAGLGVLLLAIVFNPFQHVDFGVLTALSAEDLQVGGLLIGGILILLFCSFAVPLVLAKPLVGGVAIGIAVWLLIGTGSKGNAVVYVLFVALHVRRLGKRSIRTQRQRQLHRVLLLTLVVAAPVVLGYSAAVRSGSTDVSTTQALRSVVGRFTQQDVSAVVFALEDWRSGFRGEYLSGTTRSIVPGFLDPEKPLNPAYAVSVVFGSPFTAASLSIFGSLLVATNTWLYWPSLAVVAWCVGRIDGRIFGRDDLGLRTHFEWYMFFSWAVFFEGNWVVWIYQMVALLIWRRVLVGYSRRVEAFRTQRLSMFVGRPQVGLIE